MIVKIIQRLLLIFYILKKKKYVQLIFQKLIRIVIPNEEKECWHYLAVKKLSTLSHGTTSKHNGDIYCLDFLHPFRTENELKSHDNVCKNKDFCVIVMPPKSDNILEFNQYIKFEKCHTLFMLILNL